MAHFHKMPNGQRISTQTITVPGSTITIGLWGYLDFSRKELFVDWCPQVGINLVRKGIVGNSRLYYRQSKTLRVPRRHGGNRYTEDLKGEPLHPPLHTKWVVLKRWGWSGC
jgi:hypothetical protein